MDYIKALISAEKLKELKIYNHIPEKENMDLMSELDHLEEIEKNLAL